MLWNNKNSSNKTTNKEIGNNWELYAERYLQNNGLDLVTNNFHCRQGEIDLIMKDGDYFVFIEVKYRKNDRYGGAISAVTSNKQKKIIKTATFFLQQQRLNEYNTACRFDVVAIEGDVNQPKINWLKNAFS